MKKRLLRLLFLITLFSGMRTDVKAQLVYIPDSNFRAYLNQYFGSCMVGNSIDPTCQDLFAVTDINVSGRGIADLTGINVFSNCATLNCSNNALVYLQFTICNKYFAL
ncbi:MAG: hypothetical protein IPP46_11765 [Bacteroidetes bacterium]|nr:hypothetical protein [Bacteroidota bacterium]